MAPLHQLTAVTTGILSHICYFNRGEHHFHGVRYIQIFVATFATTVIALFQLGEPIDSALAHVAPLVFYYLAGLFTSLLIYRLFLHPLNKFPGPLGARFSNLWFSSQLKDSDGFRKIQKLHEHYGDFVRIGSSDLSITHPTAINVIYGPNSKCTKSAWYDINRPRISLQTIRVKALHHERRREWSGAFSDKSLRGYEERIWKYTSKLIVQIEAFDGQPINVSKWFNLYTFDIMGDLAFGESFQMLEAGKDHWAIKLLNGGVEPFKWLFPTWFFRLLTAIPGATRDYWNFIG